MHKIFMNANGIIEAFQIKYLLSIFFITSFVAVIFLIIWLGGFIVAELDVVIALLTYIVVCVLLFFVYHYLGWFKFITVAHICSAFLLVSFILIRVPNDEMRFTWFYFVVVSVFILLGPKAGWVAGCLSITTVAGGAIFGQFKISMVALSTFSIGVWCASAFAHTCMEEAKKLTDRLAAAIASLEFVARHDALTGLLNRTAFREEAGQVTCVANETGGSYSIIYLDVDHFKSVNDRFGHAAGDAVLASVAQTIRAVVRNSDIVARIGGEEFLIMLPETNMLSASNMAEILRASIEAKPVTISEEREISVTVSIGWATSVSPHVDLDRIMQAADRAMYRAKQAGRNRVEGVDVTPQA